MQATASNSQRSHKHKTGKQIQSDVLDYIRRGKYVELGLLKGNVLAYKVEVANERGVPDLLCCVNGKFVGVEIKGYSDRTTAIQVAQAKRIISAGGESFIVKSLDDFKNIIREIS